MRSCGAHLLFFWGLRLIKINIRFKLRYNKTMFIMNILAYIYICKFFIFKPTNIINIFIDLLDQIL